MKRFIVSALLVIWFFISFIFMIGEAPEDMSLLNFAIIKAGSMASIYFNYKATMKCVEKGIITLD